MQLEHVEEVDEILYLVMEMMNGGELFDYIIAKNTLTEREASGIIRQVASAIEPRTPPQHARHVHLPPQSLAVSASSLLVPANPSAVCAPHA